VLANTLAGHDQSTVEEYLGALDLDVIGLEAVNLVAPNRETVNLEAIYCQAFAMEGETLFIGQLVIVAM
jgi:hypothetical protein